MENAYYKYGRKKKSLVLGELRNMSSLNRAQQIFCLSVIVTEIEQERDRSLVKLMLYDREH